MSHTHHFHRGHTILEMLLAMVSAVLVITGALLLFLGGIRVATQTQANSQALRLGSTSVDRMRFSLSEATAFILPDKTTTNANATDSRWSEARLGNPSDYIVRNPSDTSQTLNTALFVTLPAPLNMIVRTTVNQNQIIPLPSRRRITSGLLLYRGDSSGKPAANNGTYLWAWRYEGGGNVSRTVIYRRLSSQWDAVAFRRDAEQTNVLRYRLVHAEKDSYNTERSQLGKSSSEMLESSDYTIALVNYAGGTAPLAALPSTGEQKP